MARFNASGLVYRAQLCFDHFLTKGERTGFKVGLNIGYTFTPGNWKFENNGQAVDNAPSLNMSGGFVSITIGGGALFPKLNK